MADDAVIRERDIVNLDGSIDQLISELTNLGSSYNELTKNIRNNANNIKKALQGVSGATQAGKEAIENAEEAVEKLLAAQRAYALSLTEVGKETVRLKERTKQNNKATAAEVRGANELAGQYHELNKTLKEAIANFKGLDASASITEFNAAGEAVQKAAAAFNVLNAQLKAFTSSMAGVSNLRAKIDLVDTQEGKDLIALREELKNLIAQERERIRLNQVAADSYVAKAAQVKNLEAQLKALSQTEAAGTTGDTLRQQIAALKQEMQAIIGVAQEEKISQTELEKAIERLNQVRSQEGQEILRTKELIALESKLHRQDTAAADALEVAKRKLNNATSAESRELYNINQELTKNIKLMQLDETIANSAEGSYEQVAAQYAKNKILLEQHARATAADRAEVEELEKATKDLYVRMKNMQESMGNHKLALGEYNKVWSGLRYSVNQVVRELPTVTLGADMFFLAISNNIPIVIDELQRLKEKNKALRAEGKPTKSAIKEIVGALFSWQTALIIGISLLTKHGEAVIKWFKGLFKAKNEVISVYEALDNINEKLKDIKSYGDNVVALKKLANEYKSLSTNEEITKWIKKNQEAFKKLGLSITSVSEADTAFINQTNEVIKAFQLRARAEAAMELAAEAYRKALEKRNEAETAETEGPSFWDKTRGRYLAAFLSTDASPEAAAKNIAAVQKAAGQNIIGEYSDAAQTIKKTIEQTKEQYEKDISEAYTKGDRALAKDLRAKLNAQVDSLENRLKAYGETAKEATENVVAANISAIEGQEYLDKYAEAEANRYTQERIRALEDEAAALDATGDRYFGIMRGYTDSARNLLKELGIDDTLGSGLGKRLIDLTNTIFKNAIKIEKEYEKSVTNLLNDEYAKRRKAAQDQIDNENNKLEEMYRMNKEYIANTDGKYKELTEEQKKQIAQQQQWIKDTIANNNELLAQQLKRIDNEQRIYSLQVKRNKVPYAGSVGSDETIATSNLMLSPHEDSIVGSLLEERKLVEENLKAEYTLIFDTNKKLVAAGDKRARSEEEILIEYTKKYAQIWADYDKQILNLRARNIENQHKLVTEGSHEELKLLIKQNEIARQLALAENVAKPAEEQVSSDAINAIYNKQSQDLITKFQLDTLKATQEVEAARFEIIEHSETDILKFRIAQQLEYLRYQEGLARLGLLDLTPEQLEKIRAEIAKLEKEEKEAGNFINSIAERGLEGALLDKLGFSKEAIDAFGQAVNTTVDYLQQIIDKEVELAEAAISAAEARVSAAQEAYDAEVEARNNGYAHNVATAKKELEEEKRAQQEKQQLLEEAQRRQEAIDTAMQASSLITASANLWKSLSGVAIIGPALAIAAIAAMWGSFAASKIKARQVTASADTYGDGGLEFLEGGSHASGNDIDLHTKNSRGNNMRAEGGEAMAIINKRQTRKYKKVLPDIVDSLNKGIFEDKYINAFKAADTFHLLVQQGNTPQINLSNIENDLRQIRKKKDTNYQVLPNGNIVTVNGNVTRIIKN